MSTTATADEWSVVIIGGGIAGCSAAYHLAKAGVRKILLIEAGDPGDGSFDAIKAPTNGSFRPGDFGGEDGDSFKFAQRSGTAVLPAPANNIKMMVNLYPSSSADFCNHHGKEGARRYLALAAEGIQMEKDLALVSMSPENMFRSYGSLYVAEDKDVTALRQEYDLLVELNCQGIEWWDEDQVQAHAGGKAAEFSGGIYFPFDGVINSGQYCKDLLSHISERYPGAVEVLRDVVVSIDTDSQPSSVLVNTQSQQIRGNSVVLATGGLFVDPSIGGILRPCWSYLVGIQDHRPAARQTAEAGTESDWTEDPYPSSPFPSAPLRTPNSINLFTWGFTHDWCMTNGYLRLSGADHFSSLKPPRMEERCHELASWAYQKYPYLLPTPPPNSEAPPGLLTAPPSAGSPSADAPYAQQYGVYSETPDSAPLVGTPHNRSKVCYLLGCNAWGQASLSYAASLVPGILGFEKLTLKQREYLSVLTIRRYALLPCVRQGSL